MNDERNILLIFKEGINYTEDLPQNLSRLLSNLETPLFSQMALQYNKNNTLYKKPNFEEGWNLYNPEKEYQRQGITGLNYDYDQNKLFRKTSLNENYLLFIDENKSDRYYWEKTFDELGIKFDRENLPKEYYQIYKLTYHLMWKKD